MVYIEYDKLSETKAKVTYVHYKPELLPEDKKNKGVLLHAVIPERVESKGKEEILYINPQTNELWYEYIDIPLTPEDEQARKTKELETALLEMSTLSAIQQEQNEQAILELTTLIGGLM